MSNFSEEFPGLGISYSKNELRYALAIVEAMQRFATNAPIVSGEGNDSGENATKSNQEKLLEKLELFFDEIKGQDFVRVKDSSSLDFFTKNFGRITDSATETYSEPTDIQTFMSLFKGLFFNKFNLSLSELKSDILASLPMDMYEGQAETMRVENYEHKLRENQTNVGVYGRDGFVNFRTQGFKLINCQYKVEDCNENNPITVKFDFTLEKDASKNFWSNLAPEEEVYTHKKDGIYSVIKDKLACPYVRLYVVESLGSARITRTLFNGR